MCCIFSLVGFWGVLRVLITLQMYVVIIIIIKVMAFGLFLMDTKDGPNIYKMDAKKRVCIAKIDRILKVNS